MRSTQFDEHPPFEGEPEESHVRKQRNNLCQTIERLGYAQQNQVVLYGEVFDLVSNPVTVGKDLVFVDALERSSGRIRRVRIPPAIVQRARTMRRAG